MAKNNKIIKNSFNTSVRKFFRDLKKDLLFYKHYPKAAELINHFEIEMKDNSFVFARKNIDKSKEFAIEMIVKHDHISLDNWKKCISFLLRNKRRTSSWWGKVQINHLGTIIKLYNHYVDDVSKQKKQSNNGRQRFHEY